MQRETDIRQGLLEHCALIFYIFAICTFDYSSLLYLSERIGLMAAVCPDELTGASLELKVLIAISAVGGYEDNGEDIQAFLSKPLDWVALLNGAVAHNIVPLLHAQLQRLGGEIVPRVILATLERSAALIRERAFLLDGELRRISEELDKEDIPFVPLKGPTLARRLYGDVALRSMRDLDFLVPENQKEKAQAALEKLGYEGPSGLTPAQRRCVQDFNGQVCMVHKERDIAVEPHWALVPKNLAASIHYDALWERLRETTNGEGRSLDLSKEDLLILLCLHGSKECWRCLKWISDLAHCLARSSSLDWLLIQAHAKEYEIARQVKVSLLVVQAVYKVLLPDDIVVWCRGDKIAVSLAASVVKKLVKGKGIAVPSHNFSRFRFAMLEGFGHKLHYCVLTLLTPRRQHFQLMRLPDEVFFAYYGVRLVHDYAALPLWLTARRLFG